MKASALNLEDPTAPMCCQFHGQLTCKGGELKTDDVDVKSELGFSGYGIIEFAESSCRCFNHRPVRLHERERHPEVARFFSFWFLYVPVKRPAYLGLGGMVVGAVKDF